MRPQLGSDMKFGDLLCLLRRLPFDPLSFPSAIGIATRISPRRVCLSRCVASLFLLFLFLSPLSFLLHYSQMPPSLSDAPCDFISMHLDRMCEIANLVFVWETQRFPNLQQSLPFRKVQQQLFPHLRCSVHPTVQQFIPPLMLMVSRHTMNTVTHCLTPNERNSPKSIRNDCGSFKRRSDFFSKKSKKFCSYLFTLKVMTR